MTSKKRVSILALLGLVTAIVAVIMAAMAVTGYRSGDQHFVTAIQTFERAAYIAVAALAVSLIGLWRAHRLHRGLWPGLLGALLALPLVVFIANFEYAARAYPPINDISTDTEDPPTFWDVPNPVTYPGEHVAELQRQGYPDLKPLSLSLDADQGFELALAVARDMGWAIVAENRADRQIEAVDTTWLFGFKDNVVIRLQDDGGRTRVDVRSHSRLGRIDRGANARRIQHYLRALAQRAQKPGE